jgi:hypothetical protein
VVAQRVDCYPTNLRVFTGSIVSRDHALDFVAKSFVERSLASNGSPASGLGAAPGFENFAPALRLETSGLAFSQRPAQSSRQRL